MYTKAVYMYVHVAVACVYVWFQQWLGPIIEFGRIVVASRASEQPAS